MTNNTIHSVPRELLEEVMLAAQRMPVRGPSIRAKLHALLSAPSPAGVDGLEVVAWQTNREGDSTFPRLHKTEGGAQKWVEFCNSGPRITKEPLSRTNQAAYIINSLRGEIERIGLAYKEMGPWRDSAAQRIGELEGLLLRVQVSLSLDDTEWGYSGAEKYKLLADIRAALSAGKEGE